LFEWDAEPPAPDRSFSDRLGVSESVVRRGKTRAMAAFQHSLVGSLLALLLALSSVQADEPASTIPSPITQELLQLSLEDLGKVKVTTVSRKSESLSDAAAAIYVITQDEIRRSGITLLPEALRMVPGLEVARANSRQWAISSRGFNNTFANKLLVLMDGRTIYTPLFSGVFWEETDTVLEDLDRIEVIRGPGATLWGANAVNGVINIITKSAQDTQGTLISGGGGTEERGFGTVRYGGRLATNAYYRIYGKYSDHDEFTQIDGRGADDNWSMAQTGFRIDWEPSEINRLTVQGDYFEAQLGGRLNVHSLNPPGLFAESFRSEAKGGNLLGRWTHAFSAESELRVQASYDRTDREYGIARELRDTVDIDAQHRFPIGERQEIVWGAGYRYSADDISQTSDFQMRDPRVGLQLASAFVQDAVTLAPDRLHLTLGTKVEHNDFTGFEVQPSVRMAWTPHKRHTLWGAVSRAVRTPARVERDVTGYADVGALLPPLPLPLLAPGSGNPNFGSEELLAYEIGYRVEINPKLTLDCAAFYNDYDHLQSITALTPSVAFSPGASPMPYLVLPLTYYNNIYGETYGVEMSGTWQPLDAWRLRAGYTYLRMQLRTRSELKSFTEDSEGINPCHQVLLWSDVDLGRHVEWGVGLRHIDRLPSLLEQIPSYTELETRLAWKPNRSCELAIVGRNLLHAHHPEFSPTVITTRNVQVDRAVYGKITLRF
jgi:iron complex outermembrane receptor protein